MSSAVLFLIFNRPTLVEQVMGALRAARPPRLYVAADGPRPLHHGDAEKCDEARRIAAAVDWPCEIMTLFRDHHLGCRLGVSTAIDWFFEREEEGIILEDDCVPSQAFFPFCSALLDKYRTDTRVMSICGSSFFDDPTDFDYVFSYYPDMWGWATWRRAWHLYDRQLAHWPRLKQMKFLNTILGSNPHFAPYWSKIFDRTTAGEIDSWAYPWILSVMAQGGLACHPASNLVTNIGFSEDATHTIHSGPGPKPLMAERPHEEVSFPLRHPPFMARVPAIEESIGKHRLDIPVTNARAAKPSIRSRIGSWRGTTFARLMFAVQHAISTHRDVNDEFLVECRRVVHIGANSGQERELYDHYDLEVVWIEPVPQVYQQLVRNIESYPKQRAVQALLTDHVDDRVTLNIANNSGASSSIFDLALHKDIWPEVNFVDNVELRTDTLDSLVQRGILQTPIDALILDTQGSELLVLKGSQSVLRQTSFVKVEAADFESYKGGATVQAIKDFMKGFAFRLVRANKFASHPRGGGYYDLLFEREDRRHASRHRTTGTALV